jgi:hypothetical protein
MVRLVNRAKMTTATTGTGTVTLGTASDGFQTFAGAGVVDGDLVRYVIEEGDNFEIGTGTYTASGTTLTRNPSESSAAGAAITLAGEALVFLTAANADISPTGGGTNRVFYENDQVVTTDYTIPANQNAMSTGPITINAGATVTVSTGARYVVI